MNNQCSTVWAFICLLGLFPHCDSDVPKLTLDGRYAGILLFGGQHRKLLRCCPCRLQSKQRQWHYKKRETIIWREHTQKKEQFILLCKIEIWQLFFALAWASDAASSSVFFFFFLLLLDLAAPPEGSSVSFSSSDTWHSTHTHSGYLKIRNTKSCNRGVHKGTTGLCG